jgi:hypothetical protein
MPAVLPETAEGMPHALPKGLGHNPAIVDLRDVPAEDVCHPIFGAAWRWSPHRLQPVDDDRAGVGAVALAGPSRHGAKTWCWRIRTQDALPPDGEALVDNARPHLQ